MASIPRVPCSLLSLPVEILVCIGERLPLSNAAVFELCCRHTRHKLAYHFTRQLHRPSMQHLRAQIQCLYTHEMDRPMLLTPLEKETQDFMLLLERDEADRLYCHYCLCLHTAEETKKGLVPGHDEAQVQSSQPTASTLPCTIGNRCAVRYGDNFTYANVRMLIRASIRGLPLAPHLKKLNHTEVRDAFTAINKTYTNDALRGLCPQIIRSVQVRRAEDVSNGNILLREQNYILLKSLDRLDMAPYFVGYRIPCEHMSIFRNRPSPMALPKDTSHILWFIQCALRCQNTNNKRHVCFELHKCGRCQAEYQLKVLDLGFCFAVVITSWKNLGKCESPWDAKWTRHFDGYVNTSTFQNGSEPRLCKKFFEASGEKEDEIEIEAICKQLMRFDRGDDRRPEESVIRGKIEEFLKGTIGKAYD